MPTYRVTDTRINESLGLYDAESPKEACVRAAIDPHPSVYRGRMYQGRPIMPPVPDEDLVTEQVLTWPQTEWPSS